MLARISLVSVLLFAACAGAGVVDTQESGAPTRHRCLRLRANEGAMMEATVRVVVVAEDPSGVRHTANGVAAAGGTTRGLCESLKFSLAHKKCAAVYEDGDPSAADPLARAMHQVIVVPAGWVLVIAEAQNPDGSPSNVVRVSLEARE